MKRQLKKEIEELIRMIDLGPWAKSKENGWEFGRLGVPVLYTVAL